MFTQAKTHLLAFTLLTISGLTTQAAIPDDPSPAMPAMKPKCTGTPPAKWAGSGSFQDFCTGNGINEGGCTCVPDVEGAGGAHTISCGTVEPDFATGLGGNVDAEGDILALCVAPACSC